MGLAHSLTIQACSLSFIQCFQVPLRHRATHLSGNSAAVESIAGQVMAEKTGLLECLRHYLEFFVNWCRKEDSNP
jgi:hypothetical protein